MYVRLCADLSFVHGKWLHRTMRGFYLVSSENCRAFLLCKCLRIGFKYNFFSHNYFYFIFFVKPEGIQ